MKVLVLYWNSTSAESKNQKGNRKMADEDQIIETIDENGNVIKFELFDIVEVDEQEYALLLPVEEEEGDEVVLMKLTKDGEEYLFETIDDDEEFEKVAAYVESMEDEDEDEE